MKDILFSAVAVALISAAAHIIDPTNADPIIVLGGVCVVVGVLWMALTVET